MQVNFYATLRPIVGAKSIDVPLPEGITVEELLADIIERYPQLHSELFDEQGALYRHVHVFINGRDAPFLANALETVLTSNDTIDIFPAVAGG